MPYQRDPYLKALPSKMVLYMLAAMLSTIGQIEYEISELDEGYETVREDYMLSDLKQNRDSYLREIEFRGWTRAHAVKFIKGHELMVIGWGRSLSV